MLEATEADDFDARGYFMGVLDVLSARGFEHREYDPVDEADGWQLDAPPFWVWGIVVPKGIVVTVELVMQGERTLLNNWMYPPQAADAAVAQIDRILPLVKNLAGIPGREQACAKLRAMGPAPGVNETEDLDDFNAADYMDYESQLKQMGFAYFPGVGCYTKEYSVSNEPAYPAALSVALFYNSPHAFVDVYVCAVDPVSHADVIIKRLKGIPADDVYTYVNRVSRVAHKLKAIGMRSVEQVVQHARGERLLETEQDFDPREYLLFDPVADVLKRMGYQKMGDFDSYAKLVLSDLGTAHYLSVFKVDNNDPSQVLIEYQKHVAMIGFTFPWGTRLDSDKLRTVLPLLESAIKSAWEQQMPEADMKAALTALVK